MCAVCEGGVLCVSWEYSPGDCHQVLRPTPVTASSCVGYDVVTGWSVSGRLCPDGPQTVSSGAGLHLMYSTWALKYGSEPAGPGLAFS